MYAMEEFYPKEYEEFFKMAEKQNIKIPNGIAKDLDENLYKKLYNSTIIHEKPLSNALGDNFRDILTLEKVIEVFKRM
jgi:3-deoxy-alpha-D-manno-octulosonate 8-oxidase